MAGHSDSATTERPPEDSLGRVVWYMDRLLRRPEDILNLLASFAIMLLVALSILQIGLRLLPLAGAHQDICQAILFADDTTGTRCEKIVYALLFGYIDLVELSMPILAILGIAYCQRQGTHIRMDILVSRFEGRTLWIVETFAAICTLIIAILLVRFSWVFFNDAFTIGDSTTDAEIDTWPSKLLVPFAFVLLCLRMVVQLLGAVRLALSPTHAPIGVVVQKDIAEQAQEEIREAMGAEGKG